MGKSSAAGLPRLVDSHAHLDAPDFDRDREEALRRAFAAGIIAVLCPADITQPQSLTKIESLGEPFPKILAAAGVHPHQAKDFSDRHLQELRELAASGRIRAVGEIGLDYHYDFSPPARQREVFRAQLQASRALGLPAIVHSRLSGQDIIAAVDGEGFTSGGVLHCFTEDWDVAQAMLDRSFYISFSGILTFPRAEGLREVAKKVPLDRLLVETDSPYLAPVPFRGAGRRNEPAYVVETAKVLAGLRGMSLSDLAEATSANFSRLFPFEKPDGQC